MFRRINALLIGLLVFASLFTSAQAAPGKLRPGDPDRTFGGFGVDGSVDNDDYGIVRMDLHLPKPGGSMALMPDGRMVVVGHNSPALVVWRYLSNGQLDPSFSSDGYAQFQHPNNQYDLLASNVAVQADGKIVIVGSTRSEDDPTADFLLMRLTADGQIDDTFDGDTNGNGYVETGFYNDRDIASAVLIQPDGRIVAAGSATQRIGQSVITRFVVARYDSNGFLDPAFGGGDGAVAIRFGTVDTLHDIALQPNGNLVLAGVTGSDTTRDLALARLEADGSLDDTSDGDGGFSDDGKLTTDFGSDNYLAEEVAVQSDGKIVVLGDGLSSGYMIRYLPNGALDPTFAAGGADGNGKLTLPNVHLNGLALQPDGKIVAVGQDLAVTDVVFYRLRSDGTPDWSFDQDGIARPYSKGFPNWGIDVALLPDGRILSFGGEADIFISDTYRLHLLRLWPNGRLERAGQQTHGIYPGVRETAYGMAIQPDGKLLVAGEGHYPLPDFDRSNAFLTRFHANGQVDTSFGTLGNAQIPFIIPPIITPPHRGAYAVAVQPDGKIVAAGYNRATPTTPGDFLVLRWNSNGTPDTSFDSDGWKLINFSGGEDQAYALALAPDGKIVVAGNAWNGSRQVWGVARLTSTGALDTTFGPTQNGLHYLDLGGPNTAHAVLVQPDGKIVMAGHANANFALARLTSSGVLDLSFGSGAGVTITDLGGEDIIRALALAPNGWLYAGGYRILNSNGDIALAQYQPDGRLAQCPSGQVCSHWPEGKRFVGGSGFQLATALVLREDNQLVAAGCSNEQMAAAQVSTTDVNAPPVSFSTRPDFVGPYDCALGVAFGDADKNTIVLAGQQEGEGEGNIALARFGTTLYGSRVTQFITFLGPSRGSTTDPPFTLSASASSGLPVSFTSSAPAVCTVSGTTLTMTGQRGFCTITASQAGDATYLPAPTVTDHFRVD
jgi:uncharacterized delta-60 repeat protein